VDCLGGLVDLAHHCDMVAIVTLHRIGIVDGVDLFFLTQAASGALLLCLAPQFESLIYPETFISAANAGTVDRANNTTNNFIIAPCDRMSENNRLWSCTPRSASWQGPQEDTL
jgi:hypothetical protein